MYSIYFIYVQYINFYAIYFFAEGNFDLIAVWDGNGFMIQSGLPKKTENQFFRRFSAAKKRNLTIKFREWSEMMIKIQQNQEYIYTYKC